jgi:hypothetical protein
VGKWETGKVGIFHLPTFPPAHFPTCGSQENLRFAPSGSPAIRCQVMAAPGVHGFALGTVWKVAELEGGGGRGGTKPTGERIETPAALVAPPMKYLMNICGAKVGGSGGRRTITFVNGVAIASATGGTANGSRNIGSTVVFVDSARGGEGSGGGRTGRGSITASGGRGAGTAGGGGGGGANRSAGGPTVGRYPGPAAEAPGATAR